MKGGLMYRNPNFPIDNMHFKQSGANPNLVAKILATKFGFVPDC